MKWLIAIAVWPVALAAIPARDWFFGGQIYVWPFLLAACALTALANKEIAIALALGVALSQLIQLTTASPEVVQFAMYTTLGFAAFLFFGKLAAGILAVVAACYLLPLAGIDWRLAMIISEVVIVAGLSAGAAHGGSGGNLERYTPRSETSVSVFPRSGSVLDRRMHTDGD